MCMARPEAVSRAKPGPSRPGQAGPVTASSGLWPGLDPRLAGCGFCGHFFVVRICSCTDNQHDQQYISILVIPLPPALRSLSTVALLITIALLHGTSFAYLHFNTDKVKFILYIACEISGMPHLLPHDAPITKNNSSTQGLTLKSNEGHRSQGDWGRAMG
jgi:hypothetical protein